MEDRLIMSKRELERKTILEHVACGKLTLKEAGQRCLEYNKYLTYFYYATAAGNT